MAGREVREYTNLSDPKDKKWGKGKDKLDDEDIAFQRMVAKMQEVAGERGGYLHGRGALDSDDLLYLKEQMEAEEDAERLLRRTEKRAFAAFKISFHVQLNKPYLGYTSINIFCNSCLAWHVDFGHLCFSVGNQLIESTAMCFLEHWFIASFLLHCCHYCCMLLALTYNIFPQLKVIVFFLIIFVSFTCKYYFEREGE
ncbi:uncharacterized protein LOC111290433 isoform X1 [Durio zibethinus]|uniref:Uncharacterized protein LOC111290433 isoform X1 n=1 Tax=Durio zibethinus TaxID=66656 RepID=A0A6P5YAE8_DURZI|nr:uncharacterized protein LOC111290433 isoform X1 [Durio zibethinus]